MKYLLLFIEEDLTMHYRSSDNVHKRIHVRALYFGQEASVRSLYLPIWKELLYKTGIYLKGMLKVR